MIKVGCQSMVDTIQSIVLKHPRDAYQNQEKIDEEWKALNYVSTPDYLKAVSDYETFINLLHQFDIKIHFLPPDRDTTLDSVYTHDPAVVTDKGVILCRMGKEARRKEANTMELFFQETGIPILGWITGEGKLEGGDVLWIDRRTVAVGMGYRSNAEGIYQFKALLGNGVEEVIPVPLPHWNGPTDCLHLLSLISPIDHDVYLVYSRLLPVPFRQRLLERGIRLLEVPEDEYNSMACNVLTVSPRKCIMIHGNPKTKHMLMTERVEVWTYDGSEISLKGAGGPTCLTRPLLRR